jgi:hypothetical protein
MPPNYVLSRIANALTALAQLPLPGNEMPACAFPSLNLAMANKRRTGAC